jgi:uncharacterized membrane protein
MLWGTFGVNHILSLVLAFVVSFFIFIGLRKMNQTLKTISIFLLSLAGISAIIFNLVTWGSPLEYLPLHMCSITAILLPIVVLSKNNVIGNLLLVWSLGSVLAIVFNHAQGTYEILSWTFFFYFVPHFLECAVTIYLFAFKYVKLSAKYIPSTLAITSGIYTIVHLCNKMINAYCINNNVLNPSGEVITVNYMYSLKPTVPLMELMWDIIPYEYWYMYVGIIIIAAYLGIIFVAKCLIDKYRMRIV